MTFVRFNYTIAVAKMKIFLRRLAIYQLLVLVRFSVAVPAKAEP
jgi:hypothetical protein